MLYENKNHKRENMSISTFRFPINAALNDSTPHGFLEFTKLDEIFLKKANDPKSRHIQPIKVLDHRPDFKINGRVLDLRAIRQAAIKNADARYLVVNLNDTDGRVIVSLD